MLVPVTVRVGEHGQRRRRREGGDDQELPEGEPVHPAGRLVPLRVMLPRVRVASAKPEEALARRQGFGSLGKGEGGLWRRVIAGRTCGVPCPERH